MAEGSLGGLHEGTALNAPVKGQVDSEVQDLGVWGLGEKLV